jgi:DNA-binding GntR family transcriptional regulator
MAARLAVRRAVPTSSLHACVARLARAAARGDERNVVALDIDFHRALCEASDNSYLIGAYRKLEVQIRSFVTLGDAHYQDLAALPPEHEAIALAIESGDEVAADLAVRQHILDGVSVLIPTPVG